MVAMKSLITLLPFFLALTNALPQGSLQGGANAAADVEDPGVDVHENDSNDIELAASMEDAGIDVSTRWNRTSSSTDVDVNLYRDKNPDYDVVIDPNTCEGNAEIALMKWRSNCKAFNAVFRGSCYTDAPSKQKCCPLAKRKSCEHYWPAKGE